MRVRGELLSPLVAIRAWCFRSCVSYLGALALPGRKLSISRAASYRDREGAAEKLEGGGGGASQRLWWGWGEKEAHEKGPVFSSCEAGCTQDRDSVVCRVVLQMPLRQHPHPAAFPWVPECV